jgi:hypothetical protein
MLGPDTNGFLHEIKLSKMFTYSKALPIIEFMSVPHTVMNKTVKLIKLTAFNLGRKDMPDTMMVENFLKVNK